MNVWLDSVIFAFRKTEGVGHGFIGWGLVDEGCCNLPGNWEHNSEHPVGGHDALALGSIRESSRGEKLCCEDGLFCI